MTPRHMPTTPALHPVSGHPPIAGARSGPVTRSPDISARSPTPVASDPDVAGIRRRSVILDPRRGRRGGYPSAAVIGTRRRDDAAPESQAEPENDRQIAGVRNNTGHVNLITELRSRSCRPPLPDERSTPAAVHTRRALLQAPRR